MHDQFEHELLCKLAYQAWLDRGQPYGSPEQDWDSAKRMLGVFPPETAPDAASSAAIPSDTEMLDATTDA